MLPLSPATRCAPWTGALVAAVTLIAACGGGNALVAPTAVPPPAITPPAELVVPRGQAACYTSQHPAADIPAVKSYRLTASIPLPEGITPSVKSVRFAGSNGARVLEAEICFTAGQSAPPGRIDARLDLGLFSADSEKQSLNARLQPIRALPISQVVQVR